MIRIGIVGCGRILAAHLQGYRLLREAGVDDFQITALCARKENDARMYVSRNQGPAQRPAVSNLPGDPLAIGDEYLSDIQGDEVDVKIYTDYRQMIQEGPIDAVNDFTSHGLHHQVAAECFAHGKHLLSQKPLAVSMEAGRRMCDEAEARGLVLGVFENFRQSPSTRHIRWLLDSGPLGKLQMILLGYIGVWWAPNLIVAETPWRHRLVEGGGISLDLGVHFMDQIRYVGGEVKSVTAQTAVIEPTRVTLDEAGKVQERIDCDADDTFQAGIEMESGAFGNLVASWAGHGAGIKFGEGVVYYGDKGHVTGSEVDLGDGQKQNMAQLFQSGTTQEQRDKLFPLGLENSFSLNQYDWLQAVRDRREPETSGREGLRDLAAAYTILESAHAGRRVEVAEVLEGALRDFQKPIDQHFGLIS